MSSTSTPKKPKAVEPTPQEAYFFLNILVNQTNKPDVDWEAVAQASGFKNGQTANVSGVSKALHFITTEASQILSPVEVEPHHTEFTLTTKIQARFRQIKQKLGYATIGSPRKKIDVAGSKTVGGRVRKSAPSKTKVKRERPDNEGGKDDEEGGHVITKTEFDSDNKEHTAYVKEEENDDGAAAPDEYLPGGEEESYI